MQITKVQRVYLALPILLVLINYQKPSFTDRLHLNELISRSCHIVISSEMPTGDTLAVAQASNGSVNGVATQSTSHRTGQVNASRGDGRGRRRRRAPNDRQKEAPESLEQGPSGSRGGRGRGGGPHGRGRGGRGRTNRPGQAGGSSHNTASEGAGTSGRSSPIQSATPAPGLGAVDSQGGPRRRRMMNSKLTDTADVGSSSNPRRRGDKRRDETDKVEVLMSFKGPAPAADTLAGRLIKSLRTPPFADCPICFNSIHPAQPIWCCGPTTDSKLTSEC